MSSGWRKCSGSPANSLKSRVTRSWEGGSILEVYQGSPALDAGLLAAAQAVEHYERLAEDLGAAAGHERRQAAYDDA